MDLPDKVTESTLNTLGYEQSLKRVLNVRHLIWFGLSYLAPIGVFTQFGIMTPSNSIQYLLFPLIGAGLCLYFLFNLAPQTKMLGFTWLGLGVIYTAFTSNFFRKLPPNLTLE